MSKETYPFDLLPLEVVLLLLVPVLLAGPGTHTLPKIWQLRHGWEGLSENPLSQRCFRCLHR